MSLSRFPLRYYQSDMCRDIDAARSDIPTGDVMPVLPTGSGKTRIMAEQGGKTDTLKIYQAHRKELVGQIALALAKEDLPHRIIGDRNLIKFCTEQQMEKNGSSTYSPSAGIIVVSAQTLRNRNHEKWHDDVREFYSDEGHHGTQGSTWGLNREKFRNAFGVWPTATPWRTDGRGLGRHASGYIDRMLIGPDMRTLINERHLSEYEVVMDQTDIDLTMVAIGKKGEYVDKQLAKALKQSNIVGDTVDSYLKYANGRLTVVFTADVDLAEQQAARFREHGIPAEAISARNSNEERAAIGRRFEQRKTLVLVNCDLLGEGYDVPAIECCIMDRPTESYALFVQQWGRALRYAPGKTALIIDKVGNLRKFLARGYPLPDHHHTWSLDDRDTRSRTVTGGDNNTVCTNVPDCGWPYPAVMSHCPYCGEEPIKVKRKDASTVDGDLRLLTHEELEEMRKALIAASQDPDTVRRSMEAAGAPPQAYLGAANKVRQRNEARERLQRSIAVWAGIQRDMGVKESDAYNLFYALYGIDTLAALLKTAREMQVLADQLHEVTGV